ncbi:MAG: conjugal transfer protein TraR [Firmicutes bacterium]|nr:conjugal transfer protein TraR [Bacillota bacterium]
MLSKKKIRYFEKRLRAQFMELSADLGQNHDLGAERSLGDATKELSAYDNHPADLGSETYEQEKDLGLANAFRVRQAAIEEALDRIKSGKYGVCRDCGRSINEERLEALPYAATCIACQREAEDKHELRSRPVEEELLAPPFARTFTTDEDDQTAFDGEDAWQAVAQMGTAESPQDLGGNIIYEEMYSDEPRGIVADVEQEQVQEEGLAPTLDELATAEQDEKR